MNTHNYTLPAALALLTLTTAPMAGCKSNPTKAPEHVMAAIEQLEAMPNANACGAFIEQLRELSEGAGSECREVLRQVMADRGGV